MHANAKEAYLHLITTCIFNDRNSEFRTTALIEEEEQSHDKFPTLLPERKIGRGRGGMYQTELNSYSETPRLSATLRTSTLEHHLDLRIRVTCISKYKILRSYRFRRLPTIVDQLDLVLQEK